MYKRQMRIQRVICILSVIASALVFVYALGILTDLYDMLKPLSEDPTVDTSLYFDMQGFNHNLLLVGIGLILLSCTLFITNTHLRRKYYISNYISTCLVVCGTAAAAVWTITSLQPYRERFVNLDFDGIRAAMQGKPILDYVTNSTFWFDVSWGVFAFALLVCVLLILNVFWKIRLMARERDLLSGKAVQQ